MKIFELESIDTEDIKDEEVYSKNPKNDELLNAIEFENLDKVKQLTEHLKGKKFKSDSAEEKGSPLFRAVLKNQYAIVEYFIDEKIFDVNIIVGLNMTPLSHAISQKNPDLEIIKLLIRKGAWLNKFDERKRIGLLERAQNHPEIVEILLQNGVRDALTYNKTTVLNNIIGKIAEVEVDSLEFNNLWEVINLLLEYGSDPDRQDLYPKNYHLKDRHQQVKDLLENHDRSKVFNEKQAVIAQIVTSRKWQENCRKNKDKKISIDEEKLNLFSCKNISEPEIFDDNLLILFMNDNETEKAKKLAEGNEKLIQAIENNNIDEITKIIKEEKERYKELFREIRRGENVEKKVAFRRSISNNHKMIEAGENVEKIKQLLPHLTTRKDQIITAIKKDDLEGIKQLTESLFGQQINTPCNSIDEQPTLLYIAMLHGNDTIVKYFLENKIYDVNAPYTDYRHGSGNNTVLSVYISSKGAKPEIVRIMLENGLEFDYAYNRMNEYILQLCENIEILGLFFEAGLKDKKRFHSTNDKKNKLDELATRNDIKSFRLTGLLLESGADPDFRCKMNRATSRERAEKNKNTQMIELFEAREKVVKSSRFVNFEEYENVLKLMQKEMKQQGQCEQGVSSHIDPCILRNNTSSQPADFAVNHNSGVSGSNLQAASQGQNSAPVTDEIKRAVANYYARNKQNINLSFSPFLFTITGLLFSGIIVPIASGALTYKLLANMARNMKKGGLLHICLTVGAGIISGLLTAVGLRGADFISSSRQNKRIAKDIISSNPSLKPYTDKVEREVQVCMQSAGLNKSYM